MQTRATEGIVDWLKRLGLRWLLLYFVLYFFLDMPLTSLSGYRPLGQVLGWIPDLQAALWNAVVPWVGLHILGRTLSLPPAWDLGEKLYTFVQGGVILVVALIAAIPWTALDRSRQREQTLYEATRILLRYTLAAVLVITYGIPKLFGDFFGFLEPPVLMQPLGDLNSYAFMFLFFATSKLYTFVIGMGEVAGGVLVLFRRTTTIGALILSGILFNVFLLDVSYDVDVRRFSANLLLMALFLLAPEIQRITRAMLGYAIPEDPSLHAKPKVWIAAAGRIAKALFVVWVLFQIPYELELLHYIKGLPDLPMSGYYKVVDSQRHALKASATQVNAPLWQLVSIDASVWPLSDPFGYKYMLHARTTDSTLKNYLLQIKRVDSTHGRFELRRCADLDLRCQYVGQLDQSIPKTDSKSAVLEYTVNNKVLAVNGNIDGEAVSMRLHHLAQSPFQLERTRPRLIDPENTPLILSTW